MKYLIVAIVLFVTVAALLLQIKERLMPDDQIQELIENGLEELVAAQTESTLRSQPNLEWAADFVYGIYRKTIQNS